MEFNKTHTFLSFLTKRVMIEIPTFDGIFLHYTRVYSIFIYLYISLIYIILYSFYSFSL